MTIGRYVESKYSMKEGLWWYSLINSAAFSLKPPSSPNGSKHAYQAPRIHTVSRKLNC